MPDGPVYAPRGVERHLSDALDTTPVVVLEGPRAVGKTTMLGHLVGQGHVGSTVSLDDAEIRESAERDLAGWLASLPPRTAIDEAQLLPGLPLAVKKLVDARGGAGHFVLTGSGSIDRTGLGGSDPLTGRAIRLELKPLTQREIRCSQGQSVIHDAGAWNVVDALFDSPLEPSSAPRAVDRNDIARLMERGGFPLPALGGGGTARTRREAVLNAVDEAIVKVRIGDERIDVVRARKLLDTVAVRPGGLLNVTNLGDELEMTRRTVDSYLEHLERRFLVHRLANMDARPHAQGTRSAAQKLHPVDSALPMAVLHGMGRNVRRDSQLFGACLETFVVNEAVAQGRWSTTDPSFGFWRDVRRSGSNEVDLVVVDASGRRVGIEVKSSTSVRTHDADALRAMAQSGGLHRGFVVYLGADWVELDPDLWAMPIEALFGPEAWPRRRTAETVVRVDPVDVMVAADKVTVDVASATPVVASLFVSYVRADDDYEHGAIRQLVRRIADAYAAMFGEDLDVFVDRDIRWGEAWADRIGAELERTSLFLAVVTPRYLTSSACRDELIEFTAATDRLQQPKLVLPLIWRAAPRLDQDPADPVVARLRRAQGVDVGDLRFEEPGSATYRRVVEDLAQRLHDAVSEVEIAARAHGETEPADPQPSGDDLPTLDELAADVEEAAAGVADGFRELVVAINDFGEELGRVGSPGARSGGQASARAVRAWALRAGDSMQPATQQLNDVVAAVRTSWNALDRNFTGMMTRLDEFGEVFSGEDIDDLFDNIDELHRQFDAVLTDPALADTSSTLRSVAASFRGLRPSAHSVQAAITAIQDMRAGTATWVRMRPDERRS